MRELTDVLRDMWSGMNWAERCLTFFVQPMLFIIIIVMIARSMHQEFLANQPANRCPTCHQVIE